MLQTFPRNDFASNVVPPLVDIRITRAPCVAVPLLSSYVIPLLLHDFLVGMDVSKRCGISVTSCLADPVCSDNIETDNT